MDGTLKFDDKMVDTTLAEAYLKKNDFKFHSIGVDIDCNSKEHVLDKGGNKIFYHNNFDIEYRRQTMNTDQLLTSEIRKEMRDLATKIEENGELFAQLEALIRKKPKDDVKNFDIKLMLQNCLHCSQSRSQYQFEGRIFKMDENKGLYTLGAVAQQLSCFGSVCILSDKETAVVCYLFTELCHQVGLKLVSLIIQKLDNDTEPPKGMGIITNNCDIDSAVDVFLSSSTKYPWSLRRILIQESVHEEVKKIFNWKCKNSTTDAALKNLDPSLKKLSTELFLYDDKMFMFDFVGDHEQIEASQQVVLIEAYRTTKELMSLIKTHDPCYISLWCSDVAEANEIAFGADVNMVWVNDFAVFDGPPAASQAVFSPLILKVLRVHKILIKPDQLVTLNAWSKLSVWNRIKKINEALEAFKIENKHEDSIKYINELEVSVSRWKSDNFVDVKKGKHYIGRVDPVDIVFCLTGKIFHIFDIITTLINGQGIVFTYGFHGEPDITFLRFFAKNQIPTFFTFDVDCSYLCDNAIKVKSGLNLSETKVVCTNFGTIFAN